VAVSLTAHQLSCVALDRFETAATTRALSARAGTKADDTTRTDRVQLRSVRDGLPVPPRSNQSDTIP